MGFEGVVDPVADTVPHLGLGQSPVQSQCADEDDVVHPGLGGQVEDLLHDQLPGIGPPHRGQGQRDVVEGDGQLHPRPQ